jgi:hypothetical protein
LWAQFATDFSAFVGRESDHFVLAIVLAAFLALYEEPYIDLSVGEIVRLTCIDVGGTAPAPDIDGCCDSCCCVEIRDNCEYQRLHLYVSTPEVDAVSNTNNKLLHRERATRCTMLDDSSLVDVMKFRKVLCEGPRKVQDMILLNI